MNNYLFDFQIIGYTSNACLSTFARAARVKSKGQKINKNGNWLELLQTGWTSINSIENKCCVQLLGKFQFTIIKYPTKKNC